MTQDTFPLRKIYGSAGVLAAITLAGLLSALFGDGIWDELSWVALAIALVVIVWKYANPKRLRTEKDTALRKSG